MARFLVTGVAGFVGSHLAEALLAAGHDVTGVDSFSDYYARALKEANRSAVTADGRFSFAELDLADAAVADLVADTDGVFHLAAQPGVRGSWGETFATYARDNVVATQRVFEAAAAAGVRVVWASSSSVYGNAETYPTPESTTPRPISPYGVTKLTCEHLAAAYQESVGLDAVGLRYFTVYGPRQRPDMAFTRIANALVDGATFTLFGSGEQTRDVTYVGDAVAATVAGMENGRPGAVYNVGGGSETSLLDAIGLFERLAGTRLDLTRTAVARGDVRRTAADTTRARSELGWAPRTTLEEGVAAQLAWARAAHETAQE